MNLTAIRQQLSQAQQELRSRLQQIQRELQHGHSKDLEDQAQERENDDVLAALASEATEELSEVEKALERIDRGQYGICRQCRKPIPQERLKAQPTAEFCVDCASSLSL